VNRSPIASAVSFLLMGYTRNPFGLVMEDLIRDVYKVTLEEEEFLLVKQKQTSSLTRN